MKIDLHAHIVPRECFDMVGRDGKRYGPSIVLDSSGQENLVAEGRQLGPIARKLYDPETRIKDMDSIGLDMQAISISPTSFLYYADAAQGLEFFRRHNDGIAQVVKAYPKRFVGMATVPLRDVGQAVKELERAIQVLGLKAVEIASNVNGKNLDDPSFLPFYQAAQAMDIPISIHPHYVAAADRLQRYWLGNLIGNPLDTAIAVASLIFGGVLDKFPRLKFLCAHAGGNTPFIRGRWDRGYQVVPECHSAIPRPPSDYLKSFYFDTIAHWGPALAYLIETMGAEHVVLGSDYPFAMGDPDPVATVGRLTGVSAAARQKVLEESGPALLKLREP